MNCTVTNASGTNAVSPSPGFAAPAAHSVGAMPDLGSLAEVVFALLLVLALIMGVACIARRLRASGVQCAAIRIVADAALGAKERAVLLQVNGRQLLVGVGAGTVTTLHVFEPGESPAMTTSTTGSAAVAAPGHVSFRALLRRSLGLR